MFDPHEQGVVLALQRGGPCGGGLRTQDHGRASVVGLIGHLVRVGLLVGGMRGSNEAVEAVQPPQGVDGLLGQPGQVTGSGVDRVDQLA